jgi:glycine cleavage system regulatory protein
MKLALVGSRYFGATVLKALQQLPGVEISCVVAPAADDRLAHAATQAGLPLHVQPNPKLVGGDAVPPGTDLIIAAHTHARVSNEALAHARLGGVGYHPSLLPRHRGIAAVEWTILEGDPIAGGSVYHLADGWDAGAVAAQDWCFVAKGEDARSLWERALAPMGVALLSKVVRHAQDHGVLPAFEQDNRFATKAPMLRKAVVLQEAEPAGPVQLVVTVMGRDRPGIVRQLAERAQRHGANWASSRMSRIAGEFAGTVQLEVPAAAVPALTEALQGLETAGLKLMLAASDAVSGTPAGFRRLALELVGEDRVGIVSQVTAMLAARGVSIASLQTELVSSGAAAKPGFKVSAQLLVPTAQDVAALHSELGTLAQELRLDITLGEGS